MLHSLSICHICHIYGRAWNYWQCLHLKWGKFHLWVLLPFLCLKPDKLWKIKMVLDFFKSQRRSAFTDISLFSFETWFYLWRKNHWKVGNSWSSVPSVPSLPVHTHCFPDQEMESSVSLLTSCLNLVTCLFLQNKVKWCPGIFKLGHTKLCSFPWIAWYTCDASSSNLWEATCESYMERQVSSCSWVLMWHLAWTDHHPERLAQSNRQMTAAPATICSQPHRRPQVKITQSNPFDPQKCERR